MSHKINIIKDSRGAEAVCSCRHRSSWNANAQVAEDWALAHEQQVERAISGLRTRNPSLKTQRDYYLEMSQADTLSEEDRRLWKQLADELTGRLGDQGRDDQQDTPLF